MSPFAINDEKCQSANSLLWPGFEPGTYRIQVGSFTDGSNLLDFTLTTARSSLVCRFLSFLLLPPCCCSIHSPQRHQSVLVSHLICHLSLRPCFCLQGFFRRSIQKQIEYRCLRDGKCLVIRLNRNRCQYCRFKKCLAVGMSRDCEYALKPSLICHTHIGEKCLISKRFIAKDSYMKGKQMYKFSFLTQPA
jgi:hypothetical protein